MNAALVSVRCRGMALSGAVFQELIELAAVINALRAAVPGGALSDDQTAA